MTDGGAPAGRGARKMRVVIPGEAIAAASESSVGHGVARVGENLVSTLVGTVDDRSGEISVNPLNTSYMPRPGDLVVGYVEGMRANIWFIDLAAPFNAILPMSLAPGKVEFGGTRDAMGVGTAILCRVQEVDENHSSVVTMKGMGLRKLNSGFIDQVPPHLISQIIGSKGSVIQNLKDTSDCRIIVGQNGRLWIDGEPEGVRMVRDVLTVVRDSGHVSGLSGRVDEILSQ